MDMPKPTESHRRLARLAGRWTGTETMFPTPWAPNGGTADGVLESRLDCGELFLVSDYTQLKDGRPGFRGHGVYGWDEKDACYTMYWFDSMTAGGYTKVIRGRFEGDTLTFETSEPQRVRYVYRFEGDRNLVFRIESSADGASWNAFMEGRYSRA